MSHAMPAVGRPFRTSSSGPGKAHRLEPLSLTDAVLGRSHPMNDRAEQSSSVPSISPVRCSIPADYRSHRAGLRHCAVEMALWVDARR